MVIERYLAGASLGLYIMFVAEIITVFTFLINPVEEIFEPAPKIFQFISIGIAPAIILTAISYIIAKKDGSKPIAMMIIAGGISLLIGMAYSYSLLDDIQHDYLVPAVIITPPLFMAVSIPVILIGVVLFRMKKPKRKKDYV